MEENKNPLDLIPPDTRFKAVKKVMLHMQRLTFQFQQLFNKATEDVLIVMTKDMKTAMKFATSVKAGTCVVNGTGDYRSVHQAFGGYKHSGLGREGTSTTLREVTQEKNIALKNILA